MSKIIEGSKRFSYIVIPIMGFAAVYNFCLGFLQIVMLRIADCYGLDGSRWIVENEGTFRALSVLGGLVLAFLFILKVVLQDGFLKTKKEVWKQPVWHYLLIVLGTAVIAYGLNYLFVASGFVGRSEIYQWVVEMQYSTSMILGLILYGLVSPFVEEVAFRGMLYGRMRVYMSKVWAVLVSALVFGFYHGNVVQGIYGFIMGILFALVYEKYKNFYLTVIMHSIVNLVGYFVRMNGFI